MRSGIEVLIVPRPSAKSTRKLVERCLVVFRTAAWLLQLCLQGPNDATKKLTCRRHTNKLTRFLNI
jgi:hypothetical protein